MANIDATTTNQRKNYPIHRMVDMAHTVGQADFNERPIIEIRREAKPVELAVLIQGRLTDAEDVAEALTNGMTAEIDGMPALAGVLYGLIREIGQAQACLSQKLTEASHE